MINYNPRIITDGLVLCLDAANRKSYPTTGTTWTDLSGNGNTGTLTNGPTYSSANGGSIVFDGVNDTVPINSSNLIGTGTAPASVEVWFYNTKTSTGTTQPQFLYTEIWMVKQTTEFFCDILVPSSGVHYIGAGFRGSTQLSIPVVLSDFVNKWVCLQVVYTGGDKSTASSFIYYINGVEQTASRVSFGIAGGITNTNVLGFPQTTGLLLCHQGNISAYRIYNRALSASEIKQNYNATKSRYGL